MLFLTPKNGISNSKHITTHPQEAIMNGKKFSVATKSSTLRPKPQVPFDISNEEHVLAMMDLILLGKQHESIRFELMQPFQSVTEMGKMMLACHAANIITGRTFDESTFLDTIVPEVSMLSLEHDNNILSFRQPPTGSGVPKTH